MLIISRTFLDLCLLRIGPRDLPASTLLLYLALAAHVASVFALSLPVQPVFESVLSGLVDTTVLVGLTLSVLFVQRSRGRAVQTLTALAGTGAIIGFFALFPSWWWFFAEPTGYARSLPWLLMLAMVVWSLVVMAHILRQALSTSLLMALVVSGLFYWIAMAVRDALFVVTA